ncbi:hypothetical protein IJT93_10335 [bacterium]|nr:hypothetical protein [bacterium]
MAEETAVKEITIPYKPHPGQLLVHRSKARFKVLCCGQRWGKDRCTIMDLLKHCAEMAGESGRDELIPRVLAWYVAPTYKLLNQAWAEFRAYLKDAAVFHEAAKTLELPGNVVIELKSGEKPGGLVGRGVDYLAVTEAALLREDAWGAELVGRLISPGRGPKGAGGLATVNSTPRGKNWFYNLWRNGQDPLMPDWESWQFPTASNPLINKRFIEDLRRTTTDRDFRETCLAEFIDENEAEVFLRLESALVAVDKWPPDPEPLHRYAAGIDWGRRGDASVLTVVDITEEPFRLVDFLRLVQVDYSTQIRRIRRRLDVWQPFIVIPEQNSIGDPLIEELTKGFPYRLSPFITSNASKVRIIENLMLLTERQNLQLPARRVGAVLDCLVPVLFYEMRDFACKRTSYGNITYAAPPGKHDDCVMSLALACSHASRFVPGVPALAPQITEWGNMFV